jgi:uncharacterized RDD family membrane protein YckC
MPATAAQAVPGERHRPAGIVTRLAAMGVDMAVVVIIGASLYFLVAGVRLVWTPTTFEWPTAPFWGSLSFELVLAVLYLTGSWAMTGRSYGASLLGLRVLSSRGRIPGWSLSFVRAVFCVAFPIGLFWVAVSPNRRSIQDVVLRTVVVYDWRGAE